MKSEINAITQNWETGQSTGLHRKIRKENSVFRFGEICHQSFSPLPLSNPPFSFPHPAALFWDLQAQLRSSHRKDLHSILNFSVTLSNANQLLPPK